MIRSWEETSIVCFSERSLVLWYCEKRLMGFSQNRRVLSWTMTFDAAHDEDTIFDGEVR